MVLRKKPIFAGNQKRIFRRQLIASEIIKDAPKMIKFTKAIIRQCNNMVLRKKPIFAIIKKEFSAGN